MVKAKSIIIWEGTDRVTITKGYCLEKQDNCPYLYTTKVKDKGLFTKYYPVSNIDESLILPPKKLLHKGKPIPGWEVIKIMADFQTLEPCLAGIPPSMIVEIKNLRTQVEVWKSKYFEMRRMNEDREMKSKYERKVLHDMSFTGKARGQYQEGMGFGSPLMSRWGIGAPMLPQQPQQNDDE